MYIYSKPTESHLFFFAEDTWSDFSWIHRCWILCKWDKLRKMEVLEGWFRIMLEIFALQTVFGREPCFRIIIEHAWKVEDDCLTDRTHHSITNWDPSYQFSCVPTSVFLFQRLVDDWNINRERSERRIPEFQIIFPVRERWRGWPFFRLNFTQMLDHSLHLKFLWIWIKNKESKGNNK